MRKLYKIIHTFFGHKKEYCDKHYTEDFKLDYIQCNKCGTKMYHSDFVL